MGSESHNHPKATTLILGNPEHIAARMIDVFREAGYDGKFSSAVEGAIELAAAQHFDALIIGGGVTHANAARNDQKYCERTRCNSSGAETAVGSAMERFDSEGALSDEMVKWSLESILAGLSDLAQQAVAA